MLYRLLLPGHFSLNENLDRAFFISTLAGGASSS